MDVVWEYRKGREIILRKLEATVKTILVAVVLATGVAAAGRAQSTPIKWPDQVERSKWPAFYEGPIERTATICIDVAPKLPSTPQTSYYVGYELSFTPATQFQMVVDGGRPDMSPGRVSGQSSGFGFSQGRHTIEITVREPASYVRLSMMLHTNEEGDLPEAIHPCNAAAPPPPPKPSSKEPVEPIAAQIDTNLKLSPAPTIIAPPDVTLPNVNVDQYADPFAKIGPPSNGPGSGGGVGSGRGPGVGPGEGGGFGAYRIGGGVSAPVPIYRPNPECPEKASGINCSGTVMLAFVVDVDGKAKNIQVVRSRSTGLDEWAAEALAKWRFRPGYKDGEPVPVRANVEVNFGPEIHDVAHPDMDATRCGTGVTWTEEEAGYQSTWTRRSTSNVFDAKYLNGQTTVNRVSISGATVSVQRISSSDGYLCSYQGLIWEDGTTIKGTYKCPPYGSRPWKAVINCGPKEVQPAVVQPPLKPPEAIQASAPPKTADQAAQVPSKLPEAAQADAPPKPAAPPSSKPAADVPAAPADQTDDGIQWPSYIPPSKWPVLFSGAVDGGVDICLLVSPEATRLWPQGRWELKGRIPWTDLRLGIDGAEVPVSRADGFALFSSRLDAGKHTLRLTLGSPASAVNAQLVLTTPDFGDRPDLLKNCGVSPVRAAAARYGDATDAEVWPAVPGKTGLLVFSGTSLHTKAVCFEITAPKGVPLYDNDVRLGGYFLRYLVAIQPAEQYNLRMDSDSFATTAEPGSQALGAYRVTPGPHLFTVTVRHPVDRLSIELQVQGSDAPQPVALKECSGATADQLKSGVARRTASNVTQLPAAGEAGSPFHIGDGVGGPIVIYKPEPEYSEVARKAKFQGTVMLSVVVGVDGKARDVRVVRSLGMGLDEKAIEAVQKWRWKPGFKDGKPVPVRANVEVNFRLL
ncbi:MAG: energy transducer TonB [Bryobacteraceae bacterium]